MTEILDDNLYGRIHRFVNDRMGLFFTDKRKHDLLRGLSFAAETFGYRNLETCVKQLLSIEWSQKEIETLASYLTVGETYFYRHNEQIDYLIKVFMKERGRARSRRVKIWSAACCSGEEPYTIALLMRENFPDIAEWDIKIFGTDINPVFLRKAKLGVYTDHSFRKFPDNLKDKYFRKIDRNQYEICDEVKSMVEFSYLNLAAATYPSELNSTIDIDVIMCRNVFIYFHQDTIDKVVGRFRNCLLENGLFMVSPAESFMVPVSIMNKAPFSNPIVFMKQTPSQSSPVKQPPRTNFNEKFPGKPLSSATDKFEHKSGGRSKLASSPHEGEPAKPVRVLQEKRLPENIRKAYNDFFDMGRYGEAVDVIGRIKIEDFALDDQKSVLSILCKIHANSGKLDEAIRVSEQLIDKDKLDPKLYFLMASLLLEKGRVQDAVNELNKALYLDQSYVLAHFMLGNIYRSIDMYNMSNKHMLSAVSYLKKENPDNILEKSEGLTAGKLMEIIKVVLKAEGIEI